MVARIRGVIVVMSTMAIYACRTSMVCSIGPDRIHVFVLVADLLRASLSQVRSWTGLTRVTLVVDDRNTLARQIPDLTSSLPAPPRPARSAGNHGHDHDAAFNSLIAEQRSIDIMSK